MVCRSSFCHCLSFLFPFVRTHKRYYYTNKVTGDSQWEFPSEECDDDMEVDAPSEEVPTQMSVASGTSDQGGVPVWSYPGEVEHLFSARLGVVAGVK